MRLEFKHKVVLYKIADTIFLIKVNNNRQLSDPLSQRSTITDGPSDPLSQRSTITDGPSDPLSQRSTITGRPSGPLTKRSTITGEPSDPLTQRSTITGEPSEPLTQRKQASIPTHFYRPWLYIREFCRQSNNLIRMLERHKEILVTSLRTESMGR
ncbi:unnamed protein product [Mytilus coruscus]|uniref:Uncharacterized protein n=1 Tax=Mytilus coruscus TaxID=42192 RepID=A0A6J8ET34_MYTCO|nr:unnamed protein product [Mytilus coruscus]